MRRVLGALSVLLSSLLLLTVLGAAAPADADGVPLPTNPFGDPTGANDWSCRPSADRPEPVVIVTAPSATARACSTTCRRRWWARTSACSPSTTATAAPVTSGPRRAS